MVKIPQALATIIEEVKAKNPREVEKNDYGYLAYIIIGKLNTHKMKEFGLSLAEIGTAIQHGYEIRVDFKRGDIVKWTDINGRDEHREVSEVKTYLHRTGASVYFTNGACMDAERLILVAKKENTEEAIKFKKVLDKLGEKGSIVASTNPFKF